jgi:hypothetical protein
MNTRHWIPVIAVGLCAAALALRGKSRSSYNQARVREVPLQWSSWTGAGPTVDEKYLSLMEAPEQDINVSGWLHYFYFYGRDGIPRRAGGKNIPSIDDVLSGKVYDPPRPAFYRGPDGVIRSSAHEGTNGNEAHRGQSLELLGRCGIPAAHALDLGNEVVTVNDLVQSCAQTFSLVGEVEWPTTVLLHYLPPQHSWTDRWGNRYSFSQIAKLLVSRELGEGPCEGTHALQLLTAMLILDGRYDILGPKPAGSVRSYLRKAAAHLERNQAVDGGWGRAWHTDGNVRTYTNEMKLHVTGHHLEWILDAPQDVRPSAKTIELAVEACRHRLQDSHLEDLRVQLCPFTHAIKSVVYYDQLAQGQKHP